jgi:putative membrane protein
LSPRARERAGLLLLAVAVVCTVWLAMAGKLTLYIHPRYLVFTVTMAVIALVLAIAAFAAPRHDHGERPRRAGVLALTAVGAAIAVSAAMLVLPPATLTTATADQRELNSTSIGADAQTLDSAAQQSGAAFAKFTVVDWASLLRQTSDPAFFDGKSVDIVGFITRSDDDPDDFYYVSRFIITCCAVDAQPVGVPVYEPGWAGAFAEGDWVRLSGTFGTSPSVGGGPSIVLLPDTADTVEEPSEPYLY